MQQAPIPKNEGQRLASLHNLGLLDTTPEERFDVITRTASGIFHVPISTLTLVDSRREWFKSCQGLPGREGDRAVSFCGHALITDSILVIPDTKKDDRFVDNPMVTGKPYIRFYAGVPVISADGQHVGVFCIKDIKPREFSKEDEEILKGLAFWAEVEINSRNLSLSLKQERKIREAFNSQTRKLEKLNKLQEKSSNAVAESERKFRSLIEKSTDVIALLNEKGRVEYISPAIQNILGYTPSEMKQFKNPLNLIPLPEKQRMLNAYLSLLRKPGNEVRETLQLRHKNGQFIYIEAIATNHLLDETIHAVVINFRDITAQKELDERKNEFISMASHELKTPVTSIKLFIEVLEKRLDGISDERICKSIASLKEQADRLRELVSDLLDISRIETGKLRFRYDIFRLDELIQETVESLAVTTTRHKIQYICSDPLTVHGDRYRIYQVVTNLLSNAIKYSPSEEKITVKVVKDNDNAKVSVHDLGIGVAKKDQQRIFERLYQGTDADEKTFPGLGMGLYISKEIILRHGGTIWVESAKGKGSTFYFKIPLAGKKNYET